MSEPLNQPSEPSAGVGIREQLKAQYVRENIERDRQKNLRVAQNQTLRLQQLSSATDQEQYDNLDEPPITQSQPLIDFSAMVDDDPGQEIEKTPDNKIISVEARKVINDIMSDILMNFFIGLMISIASFGILTLPFIIMRFLWGRKKTISRIRVDHRRCYGKGVCQKCAPDTFRLGQNNKAFIISPWRDNDGKIKEAAVTCCRGAIKGYDILGRCKTE